MASQQRISYWTAMAAQQSLYPTCQRQFSPRKLNFLCNNDSTTSTTQTTTLHSTEDHISCHIIFNIDHLFYAAVKRSQQLADINPKVKTDPAPESESKQPKTNTSFLIFFFFFSLPTTRDRSELT
jgi:hypothetical protein